MKKTKKIIHLIEREKRRALKVWYYCSKGVWSDTRSTLWVNTIKTVNLSVKSFMNTDLQTQACSMAYRTMLALVPALALLFAIGRGFGFQTVLQDELFGLFPGQRTAIGASLNFVDSYLNQASEGAFVGIGLVFLLWTLISLVSSVESTFNLIWSIRQGRSFWRKVTDYTAMLLILPILMICASGLTIFLSSTLQSIFHFKFMTPLVTMFLQFASWAFTWLFFTAVYMLIPNTKVRFKNALIAGIFAGTGFMLLQWAFVSGQVYVTRYNAIYGSFAFVPLLLIWLQLSWVVTLCGAVLCYSSQNIFQFQFSTDIDDISRSYRDRVTVAIATVIVRKFVRSEEPPTRRSLAIDYAIPMRLVADITDSLIEVGLVNRVVIDQKHEVYGFQPAIEPSKITLEMLIGRLANLGRSNFIPKFQSNFTAIDNIVDKVYAEVDTVTGKTLLMDIDVIDLPAKRSSSSHYHIK